MSASAGVWGARVGPPFVRRLQDTERARVLAPLLLVTGGVTAGLVAAGWWVLAHEPWEAGTTWGAVGVLGLLSGGSAVFAAQTAARWWWSRRRPDTVVLARAPSGAMATTVPRSRLALVMPWTSALWLTGTGVVLVAGAASRWPVAAVVVGALTAASGLRLVPLVLGRAVAGGVYLTPDALETRWGVETATVAWEHVVPLTPPLPPALLRTPGLRVTRSFRVQMPVDVTDRLDEPVVQVPAPYLSVDPAAVHALLHLGTHRPRARARFGTPDSLTWHVVAPDRRG
ncbi:hypothetical protein [Phycicoccus flavus]|uniref:hypothetical protein n=1 Tax=Phycicoccus flavus TaxID=2502783 RepID=UPI000FEBCB85|nr:hypothetical protein [Phycicoccus flavus]NHA69613.1 hypothetical protein [Phycicoccus flavus]